MAVDTVHCKNMRKCAMRIQHRALTVHSWSLLKGLELFDRDGMLCMFTRRVLVPACLVQLLAGGFAFLDTPRGCHVSGGICMLASAVYMLLGQFALCPGVWEK